jgi:hypothetical protein
MKKGKVLLLAAGSVLASMLAVSILARSAGDPEPVPARKSPEEIRAAFEAHRGEFDYLLGDWRFTSVSREWGRGQGYWSAVALAEGQVLDEYRIVGDHGETYFVTTTVRAYNAVLGRWELIGMDAGDGLHDFGTARKVGDEMHIEQTFGVMSGEPSSWRIRYYDIQPDRFSWRADRSNDGGKSWEKDHLKIEARRIGPPRRLGPLAAAPAAAQR